MAHLECKIQTNLKPRVFVSESTENKEKKGRDMTQSYDKGPFTNRIVKMVKWQHKQRHKKFDYTPIADRLRTVSGSNYNHLTCVVYRFYRAHLPTYHNSSAIEGMRMFLYSDIVTFERFSEWYNCVTRPWKIAFMFNLNVFGNWSVRLYGTDWGRSIKEDIHGPLGIRVETMCPWGVSVCCLASYTRPWLSPTCISFHLGSVLRYKIVNFNLQNSAEHHLYTHYCKNKIIILWLRHRTWENLAWAAVEY